MKPLTIRLASDLEATMDDQCQWTSDNEQLATILNLDTEMVLMDYGSASGSRVAFVFHKIVERTKAVAHRFDYEDPDLPDDAIF